MQRLDEMSRKQLAIWYIFNPTTSLGSLTMNILNTTFLGLQLSDWIK